MIKVTIETITDAQIRRLRDEANVAGDNQMADLCASALGGNVDHRLACVVAINDAAAQDDETDSDAVKATIEERGNGLPEVGDYVPGDDGNLYLVESLIGPIQTGRAPGCGNWIRATVTLADWNDCEEGEEHSSLATVSDDA